MADYEQSDAAPGRLLWFAAGVCLMVAVAALGMGWLHRMWFSAGGPLSPPEPTRVVVNPDPAELHSYRWLDRSQGLVQIPIEEAMQVVSQGGSRASDAATVPTLDHSAGGRAGPPVRATPGSPTPSAEPDR